MFFGNPHIPYSWETISTTYVGYTVLFSEDFFKASDRSESLQNSPLFKIGGTPVLKIDEQQREFLNTIFRKMIEEQKSDYIYKDDLIRNYINLIIHEALKLQPSEHYDQHKNAASRLTSVFIELLERQFPIESTDNPLRLKTAQDYANALHVHVNYLNHALTEGLRMEVKPYNIRTTIVCPGAVKTELLEHITEADVQQANKDYVGAVGISPDSFARVVAFAISQPEDVDINEIIFRPTSQEM